MRAADATYRVLIVDDDVTDQALYIRILNRRGSNPCEVRTASDGSAGLAALREQVPDCVLLDFGLPDMNGLEFLAAAEVDRELPCAFVLVTGQGNEATAVGAMKCGAQDYLVKDRINDSSLWRSIKTAVSQMELRQRLAESMRHLTAANAALEQEVSIRKVIEAELRAAKEQADQANRAKSRFLAGMSHELRTPLNGIMGYAQLLHMDPSLTPKQRGRVDAMFGAGKHLLEMITCVLDLSEIEADHVELRAVPVDVQSIAGACLDLIRPAAEAKGLALTLVVASGTRCELTVDPTRLRQVLLNLLGNAAKFTSNGSIALCLRASQDGSMLRIEVVDTGVGVPAHQLRRLFNEFERLDNEATRAAEGSGLGLALSARLTTLMGGRIGHENNPDGGSIFWLELPLPTGAASPGQPTATANQEKVASPPTHPLRVLIADDVPMNRDVGAAFLRAAGHDVISVEDGAQAFDTAARTDFDVVLMDVRMPVMDGLEATRRIRSLEGCRGQVPIVALTAHAFREQVAECETAGMTSHLAKPFTMQALIAAVYDAFASRKSPDAQPACADTAVNRPDAPATTPAVPAPPVLNRAMLDSTVAFLAPDAVAVYMRAIADQCETLLVGLRAANAGAPSAETLACAAHTLAGSAGTFGFERLSAAGRCFERAVETAGQGAHPDAGDLCAALEATLLAIDGMARGVDEAAA